MVGRINQGPPVSGGGVAAPLSGGRAPIPAEIKTNEAGPVDRTDSRSDPRTLLGLDDAAAKSDWRRGKTDPAASRAKVTSLTGFMGATAREMERVGWTKKVDHRMGKLLSSFADATGPDVIAHASDAQLQTLAEGLRHWLAAAEQATHAGEPVPAKLAQLVATTKERFPELAKQFESARHQEVILDPAAKSVDALFGKPLPSGAARATVYFEGGMDDQRLGLLLDLAEQHGIELSLLDVDNERTSKIAVGADGKLTCDDPALAARMPDRMGVVFDASRSGVLEALDDAAKTGVKSVTVRVDDADASTHGQALLAQLLAVPARLGTPTVIETAGGKPLVSVEAGKEGASIRVHAGLGLDAAASAKVLRAGLATGDVNGMRIDGAGGFVRQSGGPAPRIPGDTPASAANAAMSEILAARLGAAAGSDGPDPAALAAFFKSAMRHTALAQNTEGTGPSSAKDWATVADRMAVFCRRPGERAQLGRVLDRIATHSEATGTKGFGNAAFVGHAGEANSAALAEIFFVAPNVPATAGALREVEGLLGDADANVSMRGASVGVVSEMLFSHDHVRRNSAANEVSRLLDLKTQARLAAKQDGARYEVITVPTDRTAGKAKTPTPDFVLRKLSDKGQGQALFIDAKNADARHFDGSNTSIEHAVFQVSKHKFALGDDRPGMIMLQLYQADRSKNAEMIDTVRDLMRDAVARHHKPDTWVHVTFEYGTHGSGGRKQLVLDPNDDWAPKGAGTSLPSALGWGP